MGDIVSYRANALSLSAPKHLAKRMLWCPDVSRNMGIHVMSGKGTGKSRLLGRFLAWLDFLRGVPTVIFDPHGPTIDNFLDKIVRLPEAEQRQLWPRVLYVDMSGSSGHVTPFPLYYRLGDESLYAISQRYLDIIRKVDPWLMTASVEGFNALWNIATYSGVILASLGYQITEVEHLIRNPKSWSSRFTQAIKNYPEARPAVDFFNQQYNQWSDAERRKRAQSYLNKVALFNLDPASKAMFGAAQPGVDWHRVIKDRLIVLLDFRHEHDLERRRFKMLWAFHYLLDFIRSRGAGRHLPLNLIIDELSALTNFQTLGVDIFAADLDELINVVARNYMVWLTIAHQELWQVDPRIQKTLLTMGTQIVGGTSDHDAAIAMARQFNRYNPYKIKREEPVWMGINYALGPLAGLLGPIPTTEPRIIDYRPVEFTPEEQELLASYKLRDQGRFHFLVRPAVNEGDVRGKLHPVTIENFDKDIYIYEELVAQARQLLSKRDGMPVVQILTEVQNRLVERQVKQIKRPRMPSLPK